MLPAVLEGWLARLTVRAQFQSPLRITVHDVSLENLPAGLDGILVAQVSDLHVGRGAWRPFRATDAARRLRGARPDLVVNTGDFLWHDDHAMPAAAVAATLTRLDDNAATPTNLAVLGNHDYRPGEEAVNTLTAALEDVGLAVLRNRVIGLEAGDGQLTVGGLTDEEPGFEDALAELCAAPRPRLVLLHVPDLAERLPVGSADLVLCGHTHAGQIVIPGLRRRLIRHFCGSNHGVGWEVINNNRAYINSGLGYTGLPFRFRAPPELSFFRLRR